MDKGKKQGEMNMQQVMEVYNRLAAPGPQHELLARMAGTWATSSKLWLEPDKPPVDSTGTSVQMMLLGGRFLQQEYTGEFMGGTFNGVGITGYDNHTKQFQTVWLDSSSTAILFFEGTAGADGKTITQECSYDDPVKGPMKWRSVTTIENEDSQLFEMFGTDKNGKEEKMMEIRYTRMK